MHRAQPFIIPPTSRTHSRVRAGTVLVLFLLAARTILQAAASEAHVVRVSTAVELQRLFRAPVDTLIVQIAPGEYYVHPTPIIDSTCGNCPDPRTRVMATVGLHLRGKRIHLLGPPDGSAVVHTAAGYGLFFEWCADGLVEHLTITDGMRDPDANATDAAIVVKHSRVVVRNNLITTNIGDTAIVRTTIVGVMGVSGREGAHITITGNRIINNSWDGIALYRDAQALIEGNIIDGVQKARGATIGGGRGVGIGVTWNARATIRSNLVTRYWKGIGLFMDAVGIVEQNIIEDMLTWGIAYWDADKGAPVGAIENNIIYKTGACGASITRTREGDAPGRFVGNVIVETAQNEKYDSPDYYCYQCALALHAVPKGFVIERNLFYHNRRATLELPTFDMPREDFLHAIAQRCEEIKRVKIFETSTFVADFCR